MKIHAQDRIQNRKVKQSGCKSKCNAGKGNQGEEEYKEREKNIPGGGQNEGLNTKRKEYEN